MKYYQKPILSDLINTPDVIIQSHEEIFGIELILKNVRLKHFKNLLKPLLKNLGPIDIKLKKILLKYLFLMMDLPPEEFFDLINTHLPNDKELAMSVAERLRQEGRQEGKKEVQENMAVRMLTEGMPEDIIVRLTDLSAEVVMNLKSKISKN